MNLAPVVRKKKRKRKPVINHTASLDSALACMMLFLNIVTVNVSSKFHFIG